MQMVAPTQKNKKLDKSKIHQKKCRGRGKAAQCQNMLARKKGEVGRDADTCVVTHRQN